MKKTIFALVAGVLTLSILGGCATSGRSVDLEDWQDGVEKYVADQGQGDPNVLRNNTWRGTQKGFSVIGGAVPQTSTDVNGILLAFQPIHNDYYYVFLVGQTKQQVVRDIRLALLTSEQGELRWIVSKPDPAALEQYISNKKQVWETALPTQSPPPDYLSFPSMLDEFEVTTTDDRVSVTHLPSGAEWVVSLRQGGQRYSPSTPTGRVTSIWAPAEIAAGAGSGQSGG